MLDLSYKVETNHEDNPDDGDEALDLSGHTLCQYLQSGKPTELLLDQPKKFSFLKFAKQTWDKEVAKIQGQWRNESNYA